MRTRIHTDSLVAQPSQEVREGSGERGQKTTGYNKKPSTNSELFPPTWPAPASQVHETCHGRHCDGG